LKDIFQHFNQVSLQKYHFLLLLNKNKWRYFIITKTKSLPSFGFLSNPKNFFLNKRVCLFTFMKLIKSLDFFTKAKEDIESSTGIGGLFSLIGLFVIFSLNFNPLNSYLKSVAFYSSSSKSPLFSAQSISKKCLLIMIPSPKKKEWILIWLFSKLLAAVKTFSLCFRVISSNSTHFNPRRRRRLTCHWYPSS